MASIDANLCSLSAELRSYLSWTIEWPVMGVAADQDSTSNDSVQPAAAIFPLTLHWGYPPKTLRGLVQATRKLFSNRILSLRQNLQSLLRAYRVY